VRDNIINGIATSHNKSASRDKESQTIPRTVWFSCLKLQIYVYGHSFPTSQETARLDNTTNGEIIASLRRQNAQFSGVKADGTYSYHCILKSNLSDFKLNHIT
jgi:hypothetical protein